MGLLPKRYFKDRAVLTGLQATLDAIVAYILWGLQLAAVASLIIFVIMGAQLVWESHQTFALPSVEKHQRLVVKVPSVPTAHPPLGSPNNLENAQAQTSENTPPVVAAPPQDGDDDETKNVAEALHIAFQGLEFLLFAPLSFLLLRSLTQYVVDLTMKECEHKIPAGVSGPEKKIEASMRADIGKQSLLDAKTLSIGLLFAIVATHLVGRLLSGKYAAKSNPSWEELVIGLGLLVFLASAYLSMEMITHRHRKHEADEH